MGRLCESRSAAYTRSAEAISHWLSLKSPGEAIDCAFIGRAARAAFANKVAAVPEEVIASLDKSIATRAEVLAVCENGGWIGVQACTAGTYPEDDLIVNQATGHGLEPHVSPK